MTNTRDTDMYDAMLFLSAAEVGSTDIADFLRLENVRIAKKCRLKIMKRIRHAGIYRDGRLCTRAKILAIAMLTLLALLFILIGYAGARLTVRITEAEDKKQLFSFTEKLGKMEIYEITELKKPKADGAVEEILAESSRFYNVKYTMPDGSILYYTQLPKKTTEGESEENIAGNSDAQIFVLVDGNPGEVYITKEGGEKSFELCWSDNEHTYSIYPAKSIEQAVMLAQSIYEQE